MEDELNMRLVFEEGDLISVRSTPSVHSFMLSPHVKQAHW